VGDALVKALAATLLVLLVAAGSISCTWLDPTLLECTVLGTQSCPDNYHCGPPEGDDQVRHCVRGATGDDDDTGQDDDDSGQDDDDTGQDDDDSGQDDDDSTAPADDGWQFKWVIANVPTPVGEQLNAVFFVTPDLGWAVGNQGRVLKSTDGGVSWAVQTNISTQAPLNDVFFLDTQRGFIVGGPAHEGIVMSTMDGGLNWRTQTLDSGELRGVFATYEGSRVWVVGKKRPQGLMTNIALSAAIVDPAVDPSVDFDDLTWTAVSESATTSFEAIAGASATGASDPVIWAVGSAGSMQQLWGASQVVGELKNASSGFDLEGVALVGTSQGQEVAWAVGANGALLRNDHSTADGWQDFSHPVSNEMASLRSVYFESHADNDFFGAIVGSGVVLRANATGDNDGDTWYSTRLPTTQWLTLNDVYVKHPHAWMVGEEGTILRGELSVQCSDDVDGDNWALCAGDCDDNDNERFPQLVAESCGDGVDRNCNGIIEPDAAHEEVTWYEDSDEDGYGTGNSWTTNCNAPIGFVAEPGDCDDEDQSLNPAATDVCEDGTDQDCDGADEVCPVDNDNDGYSPPEDCDDSDGGVHPGAWDTPGGDDLDCDGDHGAIGAGVSGRIFTSECVSSGSNRGFSVGPAGDFWGNGVPDLVFGNPACLPSAGTASGRSYLWRSSGGSAAAGLGDVLPAVGASEVLGVQGTYGAYLEGDSDTSTGYSVALGGDVNDDGLSDMLIGAPGPDATNNGGGAVYLILGRETGALVPGGTTAIGLSAAAADRTFYSTNPWDNVGESVAWAGDVDGDGYDEILIGAPHYGNNEGRVYLLDGQTIANPVVSSSGCPGTFCRDLSSLTSSDTTFTGAADSKLGGVIAAGKDITGDGRPDLALGAPNDNTVYLWFSDILNSSSSPTLGGNWSTFTSSMQLQGTVTGGQFGQSLVMLDDLPTDNNSFSCCSSSTCPIDFDCSGGETAELLIGQPGASGSHPKAFLVHSSIILEQWSLGGNALNASAGTSISFTPDASDGSTEGFGGALAAGDVDGDGQPDLLICADHAEVGGDSERGRGFLYLGNTLSANSNLGGEDASYIFHGESAGDRFCSSATFPGDIDGDGRNDVLIGAERAGNAVGKAYLFSSGAPP